VRRALVVLWVAAACSCTMAARHERDAGDSEEDGGDVEEWCELAVVEGHETNRVDLLFVVDNSGSMAEEQALLADEMHAVLQEMVDPTPSPDGEIPPAVDDLHVGVVSTDMGTGGHLIMTCENSDIGDDGALQADGRFEGCESSYSAPSCRRDECPWLEHSAEHPNDGSTSSNPPIWLDFACIARLGIDRCGFEQPLEASLAALTRQTGPGRPNSGFLRDDSVLAVIYLTDEDDCSASSPDMFDPARDDLDPLNVRCATEPDLLHPVSRYVDGLLGLRAGREDLLAVSIVVGVPVDGSWSIGEPLERLRELQRVNPSNPNELLPSCETAMGYAFPPVRMVELAYALGPAGSIGSICRSDWTGVFGPILRATRRRATGRCLDATAPPVASSDCRLVETLADDRPCPSPADSTAADRTGWHRDLGVDPAGRRRCEILPADVDGDGCPDRCECGDPLRPCTPGWFLLPEAPPCTAGRVQLSGDARVDPGGEARLECRLASCPTG